MTYVIGEPCIDVLDRACVEECPVDCIYEGARTLYIHPDECVDCGACEPVCPVEAIYYEDDLPARTCSPIKTDNAAGSSPKPCPGRDEPLGSPGGAAKTGVGWERTPNWSPLTPSGKRSPDPPGPAAGPVPAGLRGPAEKAGGRTRAACGILAGQSAAVRRAYGRAPAARGRRRRFRRSSSVSPPQIP